MGERKHKAEGGEKKDKVGQGNKAGAQVAHPILIAPTNGREQSRFKYASAP